jgi:hypothetical protein
LPDLPPADTSPDNLSTFEECTDVYDVTKVGLPFSSVGVSCDVLLTLLTSQEPDASKFRVFGCTVFAKVPDKLRRKLGEKAFRGIMDGYPHDAPGYRIYNLVTRRITTSVHLVFQEDVPGFPPSLIVDSFICDDPELDNDRGSSPQSHPLDIDPQADEALHLDPPTIAAPPPLPDHDRPSRLRSHLIPYGELVAHLSDHPRVFVSTCCDPEECQPTEDIVAQPDMATLIIGPPHLPARATPPGIALPSARDFVESTSYRAALTSAQACDW